MRRGILVVFILLLVTTLNLFGAYFSIISTELNNDALVAKGTCTFIGKSNDTFIVSYTANDNTIRLIKSEDGEVWETSKVDTVNKGLIQGMAIKDDMVVIAYQDGQKIYTVTSLDGSDTFSKPTTLTPTNMDASISGVVIDDQNTIHLLFHRHNRFWDYNYAFSTNNGASYTIRNNFTGRTDSNSTGYSPSLVYKHGNLYTVYQDNNDRFSIKVGISTDRGASWQITRINSTTGGKLSFDVDAYDPNKLIIGSFTEKGVVVYKIEDALKTNVKASVIYEDDYISPTQSAAVSIHVAINNDNLISVAFLNPKVALYEMVQSNNGGLSWDREFLSDFIKVRDFEFFSDLKSIDNNFYFARHDGEGMIILHGDIPKKEQVADFDFIVLDKFHPSYTFNLNANFIYLQFPLEVSGEYEIRHKTHNDIQLYFPIYLDEIDMKDQIADNWPEFELEESYTTYLKGGESYLMALVPLFEDPNNNRITIEFNLLSKEPVAITPSSPTLLSAKDRVIAGYYTSYVLSESSGLYGTGMNNNGELGFSGSTYEQKFIHLDNNIVDLSNGHSHTLFITKDGKLYGSGRNIYHQLGLENTDTQKSKIFIDDNVISVASGFGHSLYVKSNGDVYASGQNDNGQLGKGDYSDSKKFVKVFSGAKKVFANLTKTSFILTEEGDLYGFGNNESGQLGLVHKRNVSSPMYITNNVVDVAAGSNFTLILKNDGTVYSTGDNSSGQLGNKGVASATSFIPVARDVEKIAAGLNTSYIIDEKGRLKAAGSNQHGQYGTGNNKNSSLGVGFVTLLDDVVDVSGGRSHTIILIKDGSVLTVGLNDYYQLGRYPEGIDLGWKEAFKIK